MASELKGQANTGAAPASSGVGSGYLGQFDSYRVVACTAVVLQHSLLWTVTAGNVVPWAFVMLLHFSRTAFFFLTAVVLTYSQITRPRTDRDFWKRRYVQLGVPYLAWTAVYWVYTLLSQDGSWNQAGYLLWHDVLFGYYQLYFAVVLFQLYLVFPMALRLLRSTRHHALVMTASAAFALFLAADLHYSHSFGALSDFTRWIPRIWPWSRNVLTYQEQFVAGMLVALHLDQVRKFVGQWYRQVIVGALVVGVVATFWYLIAVWEGATTGRASDLYQPIAFLWFTAAVAALECFTLRWYQRTVSGHPPRLTALSATYLAGLTGGIYLSHVLFINLMRSALKASGISPHLDWAANVALLFALTMLVSGLFVALVLCTPLRWVLGGPVRAEQRAKLALTSPTAPDENHTIHKEAGAALQLTAPSS
jgi:peptidoglycan/LPS O-acetylase OafA/YrhL